MNVIEKNAKNIADLANKHLIKKGKSRIILAIVGAPGSGKSTVAEQVIKNLNGINSNQAALLPMDGFHYDDRVLETLGRHKHKGAPDTFDVYGLYHLLQRLQTNTDEIIAVPVFDRSIEIARAGARLIYPQTPIIICEGNYLLLNIAPWNRLKDLFDLSILLQVTEVELEKRLSLRWKNSGLSDTDVAFKVRQNDLPNGQIVLEQSSQADVYRTN